MFDARATTNIWIKYDFVAYNLIMSMLACPVSQPVSQYRLQMDTIIIGV
jgi:hypothetical protein